MACRGTLRALGKIFPGTGIEPIRTRREYSWTSKNFVGSILLIDQRSAQGYLEPEVDHEDTPHSSCNHMCRLRSDRNAFSIPYSNS